MNREDPETSLWIQSFALHEQESLDQPVNTVWSGPFLLAYRIGGLLTNFWQKKKALSTLSMLGKNIHYKNTPTQAYWKFYNQKRKIFR